MNEHEFTSMNEYIIVHNGYVHLIGVSTFALLR